MPLSVGRLIAGRLSLTDDLRLLLPRRRPPLSWASGLTTAIPAPAHDERLLYRRAYRLSASSRSLRSAPLHQLMRRMPPRKRVRAPLPTCRRKPASDTEATRCHRSLSPILILAPSASHGAPLEGSFRRVRSTGSRCCAAAHCLPSRARFARSRARSRHSTLRPAIGERRSPDRTALEGDVVFSDDATRPPDRRRTLVPRRPRSARRRTATLERLNNATTAHAFRFIVVESCQHGWPTSPAPRYARSTGTRLPRRYERMRCHLRRHGSGLSEATGVPSCLRVDQSAGTALGSVARSSPARHGRSSTCCAGTAISFLPHPAALRALDASLTVHRDYPDRRDRLLAQRISAPVSDAGVVLSSDVADLSFSGVNGRALRWPGLLRRRFASARSGLQVFRP